MLTGANRVTLASEMQESTRKFKVTADLTDVSVGTIEVPLNIEKSSKWNDCCGERLKRLQ